MMDEVCTDCGKFVNIGEWPYCPHGHGAFVQGPEPGTHPNDRVVVFESAKEGGKIQFPGRNDIPVPSRLRDRGYVRRELNVRDLPAFERQHGVANERRHFDRNGKGF